jgi:hypothetical protein
MEDLVKQDIDTINHLVQDFPSAYSFLSNWEELIENHLSKLEQIFVIVEKYYQTDNWEEFRKLLLLNAGKLVEDGLFISQKLKNYDHVGVLATYANKFKIDVDLNYSLDHIVDSIQNSNLIEALNYFYNHQSNDIYFKLTERVMNAKDMYYSLSIDEKKEVINLLNKFEVNFDDNRFQLWKLKQYSEGVHYDYDLSNEFKLFLNGYTSLFSKAYENNNQNPMYPSKEEALKVIKEYDYLKNDSIMNKKFLNILQDKKEYGLWLEVARKINEFPQKLLEDRYPFLFSEDIFKYILKEGTYEDFKMIQSSIQERWYKIESYSNPLHDVKESLLFELALRGKRLEFDEFLTHYMYVDQTKSEFIQANNWFEKKDYLLKDDVELLSSVLKEYKEYAMLDSLKQFKEQYAPEAITQEASEPVINNKSFMSSVLSFMGLVKKEATPVAPISSPEKSHEEFAHDLNQYSKSIQEKFAFLSRKIKITASIDTPIKKELCDNIEAISTNSLIIEKILQKEYNTRHVEEYIRYKSLTGKNFVQAVEQYLTFNAELKNELQSNSEIVNEYLNQFRTQVQYIQSGLDSIKLSLKDDREEDLMLRMQTETQMLKMKQNG